MLAAGLWLAGPWLIDLMATAPEVRGAARLYLPWVAAAPMLGIAGWMFDGIFIGATLTREMRNAMLASVVIYVLALVALLPAFGNHGLWAALNIFFVARGITFASRMPTLERRAFHSV